MQSLLAKDLELPAAKRAKPAPAPPPAAKPAEEDDEVDPLDGAHHLRPVMPTFIGGRANR